MESTAQIAIAMAVYNPRMDWLQAQLDSLEAQTYKDLTLLVLDDASTEKTLAEIEACVAAHIHSFPFVVRRNAQNMGSNKTFEALTEMAPSPYIAYCDQDDIWMPDKLEILMRTMQSKRAVLSFCDMLIIDENGKKVADSITEVRRRHVFQQGEGLTDTLLFRNFVTGCAMLIRADIAKAAIPFLADTVHDHWLAIYASTKGALAMADRPLLYYRIHRSNQTLVLAKVHDKADYVRIRVEANQRKLEDIRGRIPHSDTLEEAIAWNRARLAYAAGDKRATRALWSRRRLNPTTTVFELVMMPAPRPLFQLAVKMIQKGIL